jgi:hypothetical protein
MVTCSVSPDSHLTPFALDACGSEISFLSGAAKSFDSHVFRDRFGSENVQCSVYSAKASYYFSFHQLGVRLNLITRHTEQSQSVQLLFVSTIQHEGEREKRRMC